MHITLKPGEHIAVQFGQTDGEFEIHFDTPKHPRALVVEEVSQALMNVVGVIFREQFQYVEGDDDTDDGDDDELRAKPVIDGYAPHDIGQEKDRSRPVPAPAKAWLTQSAPVGFFLDAHNRIHCTSFVHCAVVPNAMHGNSAHLTHVSWRVETMSSDDTVTGEYDFYASLQELEAASGTKAARKILA